MANMTTIASFVLALALPLAAIADAPPQGNATAVRSSPPAVGNQTPAHHKVRCCSGRMQAQPRPRH
jgi:hypothetical protein